MIGLSERYKLRSLFLNIWAELHLPSPALCRVLTHFILFIYPSLPRLSSEADHDSKFHGQCANQSKSSTQFRIDNVYM